MSQPVVTQNVVVGVSSSGFVVLDVKDGNRQNDGDDERRHRGMVARPALPYLRARESAAEAGGTPVDYGWMTMGSPNTEETRKLERQVRALVRRWVHEPEHHRLRVALGDDEYYFRLAHAAAKMGRASKKTPRG